MTEPKSDFYETATGITVAHPDDIPGVEPKGQSVPDASWVRDKEAAHELAILYEKHGASKALARERALKSVHETGLTEEQIQIQTFNERLVAMYPNAFTTHIARASGEICFELKHYPSNSWLGERNYKPCRIILTPQGILVATTSPKGEDKKLYNQLESISTIKLYLEAKNTISKINSYNPTLGLIALHSDFTEADLYKNHDFVMGFIDPLVDSPYAEDYRLISARVLDIDKPDNLPEPLMKILPDLLKYVEKTHVEEKKLLQPPRYTVDEALRTFE